MEKFSVLVVDDEVDFVETIVKRLTDKGLKAAGVYRGKDALDLLNEREFDVCILDVRMPGMDGIETLREMKKKQPQHGSGYAHGPRFGRIRHSGLTAGRLQLRHEALPFQRPACTIVSGVRAQGDRRREPAQVRKDVTAESNPTSPGRSDGRMSRKSSVRVKPMSYARTQPYILSSIIALAAVPLGLRGEAGLAIGALILSLASFLQTRGLLQTSKQALQESPDAVEPDSRPQVFSSVDELSAGIAHEINNPLAIIAQETEWLQHLFDNHSLDDLHQSDDCRDCLREISHQVDRCKEIVKKLLSLARQMKPVIQDVDINNVLKTIIILAQREASEKNIEIVGRLDPDLPVLSSDPPLLRQVFLNLLVNATQAIDRGGRIIVSSKKLGTGYG